MLSKINFTDVLTNDIRPSFTISASKFSPSGEVQIIINYQENGNSSQNIKGINTSTSSNNTVNSSKSYKGTAKEIHDQIALDFPEIADLITF